MLYEKVRVEIFHGVLRMYLNVSESLFYQRSIKIRPARFFRNCACSCICRNPRGRPGHLVLMCRIRFGSGPHRGYRPAYAGVEKPSEAHVTLLTCEIAQMIILGEAAVERYGHIMSLAS